MNAISQLFPITISEVVNDDAQATLLEGDTLERLKDLPSKSVQLIITSPPYNIGKEYETPVALEHYLDWLRPITIELNRVLDDGGSICWQVGNFVDHSEVFPLDIYFYPMFKDLGLKLRNRIVWHFDHGLHASKRFSGRYETLLWFTKGEDYVFNLDPTGVTSAMLAALKRDRRAMGIDKERKYLDEARRRIELLASGVLPYRELGKPVHVPSGNDKVSRVPKEWLA